MHAQFVKMMFVAMVACGVGVQSAPNARAHQMTLRVVDEKTGEPIKDAKIDGRTYEANTRHEINQTTSDSGKAVVTFPDSDKSLRVSFTIRASGYQPYHVGFEDGRRSKDLPTEKMIKLIPGSIVRGRVVDEQGQPIESASVEMSGPADETVRGYYFTLHETRTDTEGRFTLDSVAESSSLRIRVTHPDFIRQSQPRSGDREVLFKMEPSLSLSGKIVDFRGKPVVGAIVFPGEDRFGSSQKTVTTDEQGEFKVKGLESRKVRLTVTHHRMSPQMKQIRAADFDQPVQFRMLPGRTIRFEVVDEGGQPVPGVRIVSDTWQNFRTLELVGRTDENGRLTFRGAPADEVLFDVLKRGFRAIRNRPVTASSEVHRIEFQRPIRIKGTVTDAETGLRVKSFTVDWGRIYSGNDKISWNQYERSIGSDGTLNVQYDEPAAELFVRISAAGKTPVVHGPFSKTPDEKLDIQLVTGQGMHGVVVDQQGNPVEDVQVYALSAQGYLSFQGGWQDHQRETKRVTTDVNGKFRFDPAEESEPSQSLLAIHDTGFLHREISDASKPSRLVLEPFGSIKVTVMNSEKPVVGQEVNAQANILSGAGRNVSVSMTGVTDQEGVAVFERLPGLEIRVSLPVKLPMGQWTRTGYSRHKLISLKPGQAAEATFGGRGSDISGKIVLPPDPPEPFDWNVSDFAMIKNDQIAGVLENQIQFRVKDDGSFQVADLPSGKYLLSVRLTSSKLERYQLGKQIGYVRYPFVVGEEEPKSLDLGEIQAQWGTPPPPKSPLENLWGGIQDAFRNAKQNSDAKGDPE